MADTPNFDSRSWTPGTAAGTGDERENDPRAAGFTGDEEQLFRSHFQHANRLADCQYEDMRPAYQLGQTAARSAGAASRSFEEVETDLANQWLSVRTRAGDWASVREFVRVGFDRTRGRVSGMPPSGASPSHDRATYSDPLPGNVDATEPPASP